MTLEEIIRKVLDKYPMDEDRNIVAYPKVLARELVEQICSWLSEREV